MSSSGGGDHFGWGIIIVLPIFGLLVAARGSGFRLAGRHAYHFIAHLL